MKKIDIFHPIVTLHPMPHLNYQTAGRLIVAIPETETDPAILGRQIRELANALKSDVLLLGLCKDELHEPRLHRQLTTLSAMIEDENILIKSKVKFGGNWSSFIRSELNDGDMIACFAEHNTGLAHRPLIQILESRLNNTVYVFTGLQDEPIRTPWISNMLAWGGAIGIILGFFWLQKMIITLSQDWAHTALLYISVLIEIGCIWLWNNYFSR